MVRSAPSRFGSLSRLLPRDKLRYKAGQAACHGVFAQDSFTKRASYLIDSCWFVTDGCFGADMIRFAVSLGAALDPWRLTARDGEFHESLPPR